MSSLSAERRGHTQARSKAVYHEGYEACVRHHKIAQLNSKPSLLGVKVHRNKKNCLERKYLLKQLTELSDRDSSAL